MYLIQTVRRIDLYRPTIKDNLSKLISNFFLYQWGREPKWIEIKSRLKYVVFDIKLKGLIKNNIFEQIFNTFDGI